MEAHAAGTDFLLPTEPNVTLDASSEHRPISWTKYIVVDDSNEVRGGFLLMTQGAWLNGQSIDVANYQSPLSEGIADPRFGMVGLHMLRFLQQRSPNAFVVGMGDAGRPLPRLLAAAGWTIRPVSFLFRASNPTRILRELKILRTRPLVRLGATIAASSRLGWLGAQLLQWRSVAARHAAQRVTVTRIDKWGSWADALWERLRPEHSFAVRRDRATLEQLYPLEDNRHLAYVATRDGHIAGWAVCLNTAMVDHSHFGNLRVATVLDAFGADGDASAIASRVADVLAAADADLIVTNQSRAMWVDAFRRAGFSTGPSNYLFATSKSLSAAIHDAWHSVHVTRGDGDGRIHL
jgi:hypothetical protein